MPDIDIGSVNAKLALIYENGGVVEFYSKEIGSSLRIAVNSIIARLGRIFNLEEIIAAGMLDFGRDIIPKDLFGRNIVADGNCI